MLSLWNPSIFHVKLSLAVNHDPRIYTFSRREGYTIPHSPSKAGACVRTCVLEWRVLSLFGTQSSLYQTFITSSKARHQRLLEKKNNLNSCNQCSQEGFSYFYFLNTTFLPKGSQIALKATKTHNAHIVEK